MYTYIYICTYIYIYMHTLHLGELARVLLVLEEGRLRGRL